MRGHKLRHGCYLVTFRALTRKGKVRDLSKPYTVGVRDRAGLTGHVARAVREGDVVFTLGAGDVTRVGPELLELLRAGSREHGAVA